MGMLFSKVREEFPNVFDRKRYIPPVLHLENIEGNDFFIAWQFVETFEAAGVPFVALTRMSENEIEVYVVGNIDDEEIDQIIDESRTIEGLEDCVFFVNFSVLDCGLMN